MTTKKEIVASAVSECVPGRAGPLEDRLVGKVNVGAACSQGPAKVGLAGYRATGPKRESE